jgi:glutathione peroxidase
MSNVYQFEANSLSGQPQPLADYRGKVLLIVNTASECGFTPQYAGLQTLQDPIRRAASTCWAFPATSLASRSRGDAEQIGAFCESRFHVTFPMFEKIDVNGADAHPLYKWLTSEKPGCSAPRRSSGISPSSCCAATVPSSSAMRHNQARGNPRDIESLLAEQPA